jgi:hypothetical protein
VGTGSGANNDKATPAIFAMTPSGADFIITASVISGDTIEFFRVNNAASPTVNADGTGYGEGYLFLGSCTDGGGACSGPHISGSDGSTDGMVSVTLTSSGLSAGDVVTATATDAASNTSEFAYNMAAPATSTCQVSTTASSGSGSLRECINYANSNAGTSIAFNIPNTDPGYQTAGGENWWRISPTSTLPPITAAGTTIDGTTQTTNQGNTNTLGPEIELEGSSAGAGVDGLHIDSDNNTVRSLVINRFDDNGIDIEGDGNFIEGNYIGTGFNGAGLIGNGNDGLEIEGAGNTIGGTAAGVGNIISDNGDGGRAATP